MFFFAPSPPASSLPFRPLFLRRKEESAYLRDSFAYASQTRDFFLFSSIFLFFLLDFSPESLVFPLFHLFLSLFLLRKLKTLAKSPLKSRFLLEIWLFSTISLTKPDKSMIKALRIGFIYTTFPNWPINLLSLMFDQLALGSLDPWALGLDFLLVFLFDLRNRGLWLRLTAERRKNMAFSYVLGQLKGFFMLVDPKLRLLNCNERAEKLFFADSKPKKTSLLGFLSSGERERLEACLLDGELSDPEFEFRVTISAPAGVLREIDERRAVLEEKLADFIVKLGSLKPKPAEMERSPEKPSILNWKEEKNTASGTIEAEKSEKMPFKMTAFPLMIDKKPLYFVNLASERDFLNILGNMKENLWNSHNQAIQRLGLLEQDYIKWNNLQALSTIKESDLKILSSIIFDFNFHLASQFLEYAALPPLTQIFKDFNISSLMIYILEVVSLPAMAKAHELTLFLEASFPDIVSGQFFLFKYTVLMLANLMINEFGFPKHSKFKLAGKLKEYMSIGTENHFRLSFEFTYPNNSPFTEYLKLLLQANELKDPLIFLKASKSKLKSNLTPVCYLQEALKGLEADLVFKEKAEGDPLQSFSLDASFKTVDISSLANSPVRSITLTSANMIQRSESKRVTIPNINLSFCRNVHKKNLIVWKIRTSNSASRPKSNAVMAAIQKNIELNESFKRKISVKMKEESPMHHKPPSPDTNKPRIEGFEENTNFSFSNENSPKKDEVKKSLEKTASNPERKETPPERSDPASEKGFKTESCHFKARSLDLQPEGAPVMAHTSHKSHFSQYDFPQKEPKEAKDSEKTAFSADFLKEIDKMVELNKPKLRKILTRSLLLMLQSQTSPENRPFPDEKAENPASLEEKPRERDIKGPKKKTWNPMNLRVQLHGLGVHQKGLSEDKGYEISSETLENEAEKDQFVRSSKTLTSLKASSSLLSHTNRSFEFNKRLPLSPRLPRRKRKGPLPEDLAQFKDVIEEEAILDDLQLRQTLIPFSLNLDDSTDQGLNFLLLRGEPQYRKWERNCMEGSKITISNKNKGSKVKRSPKFSMLVIDDNISHLKEYQKLSYNPSILIDFSDNYKRGKEIFLQTLEQSRCYDLLIMEMKNLEAMGLVKEIREIEEAWQVPVKGRVQISGIVARDDPSEWCGSGVDEVYCDEMDEGLLKRMVCKTSRGAALTWN